MSGNILKDIYYGNCEREFDPDEEYRRLQKESTEVWDRVGELLSTEQINAMWNSQIQLLGWEGYRDFLFGIRLGAAVMAVLAEDGRSASIPIAKAPRPL